MLYETERLIIRKWRKSDAEDLFEYMSMDVTTKYLLCPTYKTVDDAHRRIADLQKKNKQNRVDCEYAVELKKDRKVIGQIGIASYSKSAGGVARFGYTLSPLYQHNGYMTEAVLGLFRYIKQNKIAKRIESVHDLDNVASGNVLKRVGMTFEGILRKVGQNNTNPRHDKAIYSILEEEI